MAGNLSLARNALQLKTSHINHVGASWLGPREFVLDTVALQIRACEYLMTKVFVGGYEGSWPGWSRHVLALYGGHLAINHMVETGSGPSAVVSGLLDSYPFLTTEIDATVLLVHTFAHRQGHFSRREYIINGHAALRATLPPAHAPPPRIVRDYCLWVAVHAERLAWNPARFSAANTTAL